jgi:UDP-N-acetylmuramyl pentapeptide phosphotransferase/UDP-N-acetylglucosamine-1-phosphate transferase
MQTIPLLSIALVAVCISCLFSLLIVHSQEWHGKHSLDHDLSGVQKFHTTAVPRIGGVAVVAGLFLALGFGALVYPGLLLNGHASGALKLLLASMPAFIAGIMEDLTKRVSVKVRLVATIISALMASWLLGATIDGVDIWGVDSLLAIVPIAIVVTAVVVAGGANAINIIDGFNGLAGSVVVIMAAALGYLAWQTGDMFVAMLALLGIGVTLGFMLVNYPTGRLFLGDGGAYLLGFWVAEIAVLLLVRNPTINAWQVLSICAYPVIEVLFSIYRRRFVRKATPGAPDGLHLHTLVYRRFVSRLLTHGHRHRIRPWHRNAAVVCFIGPCIGLLAAISVVAGGTIPGAAAIVIGQVLLYIALYRRLVRRRWGRNDVTASAEQGGVKAELT